jgi:cysteinyl-tRNA synthetase
LLAVREIRLHDTLSGQLKPLRPRPGRPVGIYACGPTVYGRVHVGNARPYVVFSLLARFLEHEGLETELVMNVTDVNDKIYDAARVAGVPSDRLAREMTDHYVADTDRLGLGRPDHEPLASETMDAIVALIADLIAGDHAYEAQGDVYFSVRSDPRYGELSRRDPDDMNQGEEVEGAERKRDQLDFALWKAAKEGEDTAWDSPWGRGRPGWHIECSAMAEQLLGVELDVHGGGSDLVFPHHENEAAQTRAARGAPLASIWMHNGMVQMGEAKMAKSVGNIRALHEALDQYGPQALVMYFCAGHYRQPLAFSAGRLEDAARSVGRIREALRRLAPGPASPGMDERKEGFFAALADDFNTPLALRHLFDWVREANRAEQPGGRADLLEMLTVLGLESVGEDAGEGENADAEAEELRRQRDRAREERDFGAADRLRDELAERGFDVRDGPQGSELVRRQ